MIEYTGIIEAYRGFVVVGLMDYGPHIWTFDTAHETAVFMWGRSIPQYAVFYKGELVHIAAADLGELKKQFSELESNAPTN